VLEQQFKLSLKRKLANDPKRSLYLRSVMIRTTAKTIALVISVANLVN